MRVTPVLRCQPSSQTEYQSESPRMSGSAGEATKPKIVAAEKIVKYSTIRTVLGIATGNSSAVVPVVPSDQNSKRGALLGVQRRPKCHDRASTGRFGNSEHGSDRWLARARGPRLTSDGRWGRFRRADSRLITAVIDIKNPSRRLRCLSALHKPNDRHCDAKKIKPLRNQTRAAQETA